MTIDAKALREILAFVADAVELEESRLNALDAAIGDGDHGITVRLGFHAVRKARSSQPQSEEISAVLGQTGKAFMGATGGAIGIIFGRILMCGQKALAGREALGVQELKCWLAAMESTVAAVGKAKPGDKTILDALHAANLALSSRTFDPDDVVGAFRVARDAAESGARDTANMLCKVGRASKLGAQVLGHPDPGAVMFSIVMDAFYRWLEEHESPEGAPGH